MKHALRIDTPWAMGIWLAAITLAWWAVVPTAPAASQIDRACSVAIHSPSRPRN